MNIAKIPTNEKERLESLLSFDILDTEFENEYDEIVSLASNICNTPIALISLVDSHRQWFNSKIGLNVRETSRDITFCSHSLELNDILIINDTFDDSRFVDNPLVTGNPNIRFYAGAQLRTNDGNVLGTLCAIDRKPRNLDANQIQALKTLSKQVVTKFELRKSYVELQKHANNLDHQNRHKDKLFRVISHDLRSPFNSILGYTEILKEDIEELNKDEIINITNTIGDTAKNTFDLVNNLLNWSLVNSNMNGKNKTLIDLETLFDKILSVLA